jgi:hypothetical protein
MAGARRNLMRNLFYRANANEPRREVPAALIDIIMALRRRGLTAAACEAHARGMQLLKENLTPAQRDQYEKCGHFDVVGGETGRRYRIEHGSQMNVHVLDTKGRPVCSLCFMPKGAIAVGDIMLAQKLALELFESQALEVARTFPVNHSRFGPIP